MVGKLGSCNFQAYNEILNIVPELRERIGKGNLTRDIINKIARSVIIKENNSGLISVSRSKLRSKNVDIPKERIELIRKICYQYVELPEKKIKKRRLDEVQEEAVEVVEKRKIQGSVGIIRNRVKNREILDQSKECKNVLSDKLQTKSLEDFFDINNGVLPYILKITADYLSETTEIVVYLIKNKKEVPQYLTKYIDGLDLSKQDISFNDFVDIVEKFKNLKSLKLPEKATKKWLIKISEKLPNLTNLDLSDCKAIFDITSIVSLTSLTDLNLSGFEIKDMSFIADLKYLENLDLTNNINVSDISFIASLTSLVSLNLKGCTNISDIGFITSLKSLTKLNLSWCKNIRDIDKLACLASLTELNLTGCSNISDLTFIRSLTLLVNLNLAGCTNINEIGVISSLKFITTLDLSWCKNIRDIDNLAHLTSLTSLNLTGCTNISDLGFIRPLKFLTNLDITYNKNIRDISSLIYLTSLKKLNLSDCININDISSLETLTSLTDLDLSGCRAVYIDAIGNLTSLTTLNIGGIGTSDISMLANLTELRKLNMMYCGFIKDISVLKDLKHLTDVDLPPLSSSINRNSYRI